MNPILEELLIATAAMTALSALICFLYWFFTGLSPWPFVVLGEMAGFGFGITILTLTSPRRRQ